MDDTCAGEMIKGRARHLPAVNEDVIMFGTRGRNPHLLQRSRDKVEIALEGATHLSLPRDIGEHDIAPVGIDTAAATLATESMDAMRPTVVEVHLSLNILITAEDH